MIVKRKAVLRHLSRILCGGYFGEVVLFDRFACAAVTTDRTFMVVTDGLPDIDPLPEPVGVLNLERFVRAVKLYGEDANDDIAIDFTGERIVIEEAKRGGTSLLTATPTTIQTAVRPEHAANISNLVDKTKGYALPQSTAEAVLKAYGMLKPEVVRIDRQKTKTIISIGEEESDHSYTPLPRAKLRKEESSEPYELHMIAGCFTSALQQLDDFTSAEITFTGPDSVVAIWDEQVTYYMSPQEPKK